MTLVLGVDPGPIPGVCLLDVSYGQLYSAGVLQVSAGILFRVLGDLRGDEPNLIAAERYVVGKRAGRSSTAGAGQTTRDQVGALQELYAPDVVLRNAGQVKPWATDERLEAAGLLELCTGMRHARDAARHALFAAVHDAGLPDPLSTRWVR